jgi:hypothetical protein
MREGRSCGISGKPFAENCPRPLAEVEACFADGERLMRVAGEQLGGL